LPQRGARLRAGVATTPGRLRLLAALAAVATLVFGAVAYIAATVRAHATAAVAGHTEQLLVDADGLDASLSDADTTAVTTFLTGGIEPAARRRLYLADVRQAGTQLTALTQEVGSDETARAAVETIAVQLPVYTGLIEAA